MTDLIQGAVGCMNDSRTCTQSGAKLTHNVPDLVYCLDSAQRRETDETRKMALCFRLRMEIEGADAKTKARQDAKLKQRVRVQAVSQTKGSWICAR
jgi:hypothetical protein